MNCDTCTHRPDPVPFAVHESAMARMERTIRRLWILLILLVVLLVGSNALWIWYESQFEDVTVEQEVDTGKGDAFVVGNGDLNYGESQTESDKTNP